MKTLTNQELNDLLIQTGTYKETDTQELKEDCVKAYRKVEAETNKQVEEAGGITNWYERGRQ
jgi:hypothetical protein